MTAAGSRAQLAPGYDIARVIGGCWQLSEGHRDSAIDREAVLAALDARADAGLSTFDCADIYTGVEALLGTLVRRRRAAGKPAVQVHTKLVPDRSALATLDRGYVEGIVDRSLARLGVERLDLVQFHWWDFAVPGWVEALAWLDDQRRAGKVRHIGVTNFDAAHLEPVCEAGVPVVSNQVQYSLLDRRPERGLVAHAARRGYRLLAYGTLAGGFLSRAWLGRPAPPAPLANRSLTKYQLMIDEAGGWNAWQELLTGLDRLAEERGTCLEVLATAAVLERPGVAAAIVGVRDARHLAAHREAARLRLEPAARTAIDALTARIGPIAGDVYGLERQPGGRHARIMKTGLNRTGPASVTEPATDA